MSKKVRDIVHNYIYLTPIEELVTENPLFLRLHYIHQNSFAYLTYPSAHNTRFSHSLGVMHVAGAIFQAAFARTRVSDLNIFLNGLKSEFDLLKNSTINDPTAVNFSLEGVVEEMTSVETAHFFDNAVYNSFRRVTQLNSKRENERVAISVIILQALRMAAMLHDVGHPPFSHIVEYALLEGIAQRAPTVGPFGKYRGHEHASEQIAVQILGGESFDGHRYAQRTPNFVAACAAFTKAMFSSGGRLAGLKQTLLSGDVDADRLDYVLRDGKSAGLNLYYDLERLEDSAFLSSSDAGNFMVCYNLSALPTIENFFNARYDLYRWMIFHHDTSRRNLVVQRFIVLLLTSTTVDKRIKVIANKLCESASGGPNEDFINYRQFLDGTLVDIMWSIMEIIENKKSSTTDEIDLKFYLNIILSRSNFLFPSLCKTPGDYANLSVEVFRLESQTAETISIEKSSSQVNMIEKLNIAVKKKFEKLTTNVMDSLDRSSDGFRKDAEGIAKYRLAQEIEKTLRDAVNTKYGEGKYTVYFYYIGSFKASFGKPFSLHPPLGRGDPLPVRNLSPTIDMLETAWSKSPQMMIYLKTTEEDAHQLAGEDAETRETMFREIRNTVGAALGKYLIEDSI